MIHAKWAIITIAEQNNALNVKEVAMFVIQPNVLLVSMDTMRLLINSVNNVHPLVVLVMILQDHARIV